MSYYDLHLEIEDTEKAIAQARLLGFNGLGIVRNEQSLASLMKNQEIDIVSAVMLNPRTIDELKREIEKFRNRAEIICVHGGNYDINRACCEDNRVDILCHPERGRLDSGIDHICAKAAAENGVMIELNFSEILNARGRSRQLQFMERNVYLCKKYSTRMVLTSGARNIWEMRAPRELAAMANVLGMDLNVAIDSVSTIPEGKIKENREKISGSRIGNVKIVSDANG